jgi:hypothetical protein
MSSGFAAASRTLTTTKSKVVVAGIAVGVVSSVTLTALAAPSIGIAATVAVTGAIAVKGFGAVKEFGRGFKEGMQAGATKEKLVKAAAGGMLKTQLRATILKPIADTVLDPNFLNLALREAMVTI